MPERRMRTPEEIGAAKINAAAAERNLSDKEWSDAQITELAVVPVKEPEPEPVVSPVEGVSDVEYAAGLERMLHEQVVEGWELIREEEEARLKLNPDDATAQYQLLGYQQWERQQKKPKLPGRGLVIPGHKETRLVEQERTGVWKRTDRGYVIRV